MALDILRTFKSTVVLVNGKGKKGIRLIDMASVRECLGAGMAGGQDCNAQSIPEHGNVGRTRAKSANSKVNS